MPYKTPKEFSDSNLKFIKLTEYNKDKHWFVVFIEYVILFQIEFSGYYNKINGKRRIFAAIAQTLWASGALVFLVPTIRFILGQRHEFSWEFSDSEIEKILGIGGLIALVFGANFIREMKDIHNKFDYLAKLFNEIVKLKPLDKLSLTEYNQREHLLACLAHDILTMNMWAHSSFRSVFKEVIEKAMIYESRNELHLLETRLINIAKDGITHSKAKKLIEDYLEFNMSKSDLAESLFNLFAKNTNDPTPPNVESIDKKAANG